MKIKKINIPIFLATFIVSFTCLGHEVAITRIFSLVFSHYYIFLSLSAAMFGFGVGGFLVSVIKFQRKNLTTILLLLTASYPLSILIPLKITFFLSHPLLLSLLFFPAFVLTGLFISLIFSLYHSDSGIVYFFDLSGASLGALTSIFLLQIFSPINLIFIYAFFILLSAFILSRKVLILPFSVLIILFLFLNGKHLILDIPYINIPEKQGTKMLIGFLKNNRGAYIEKTYWNPSFRTDIIMTPLSPISKGIFIDGGAPTVMFKADKKLDSVQWLKNSLNYIPFLIAKRERMLSIGPGGGLDIILGLLANFKDIEAVEINSSIPRIMEDYRVFNGGFMDAKQIRFFVGEGRNYIKKTSKRYDLIILSLAQTSSSGKLGLPLVESYLHTTEAFVDYLSRLNSNGCVAVTCETDYFLQRTIFNVLVALSKSNVNFNEGSDHISIISNYLPSSPYKYLLLLKKNPFTLEEVRKIRTDAEERKLIPEHLPYVYEKPFVAYSSMDEVTDFLKATITQMKVDLSPTTDDKPYFYDLSTKAPGFLYGLCIFALTLSLVVAVFIKNKLSLRFLPNFFLLGAGFMFIEVSLVQQFLFFLGYPVTAFAVILFSLLLGCGLGGFLTQNMKNAIKKLITYMTILCLAIIIIFFVLNKLFVVLFPLNDFLKGLFSFSILVPLGILLGMPFPILIREVGNISSPDVGLMWGINGLMAIFGSSLTMIISRNFGNKWSIFLSFLAYLCVLSICLLIQKHNR